MGLPWYLKYKDVLLYGLTLAILLLGMRWLEYRYLILDHSLDLFIGIIALFFTLLGVWLAVKLSKPKTREVVIEKVIYQDKVEEDIIPTESFGLSRRELEILKQMAEGKSNQEIAEQLYISLSTVKTHVSAIFEKLEVKRRTQAIEKARSFKILQ